MTGENMEIIVILLLALILDLSLGDPPNAIHPVVWMGKLISFMKRFEMGRTPTAQFVQGVLITVMVTGLFTGAAFFILFYLRGFTIAYIIIGAALLKSTFSLRGLRKAALSVRDSLLKNEINKTRFELRSLVSRKTQGMSKEQLVSATVESVAESSCDSFIAPLFYFLLFGIPGALAYRVVNTLDAMIGYRGKYEYLGKFSSKLDDLLNFIPARIAALLLIFASFVSRRGMHYVWQMALSEHRKTDSPNAGWPMAAMAGALGVQLEKPGQYRLGTARTALIPQTIDASVQLLMIAASIWTAICFATGGVYFALTT